MVKGMMALPFDVFGYLLLFGSTIAYPEGSDQVRARQQRIRCPLDRSSLLDHRNWFYAEWMRGNSFLVGNMFEYPIYAPHFALIHTLLALGLFALILPWSKYIHVIATPMTLIANRGGE